MKSFNINEIQDSLLDKFVSRTTICKWAELGRYGTKGLAPLMSIGSIPDEVPRWF